MRARPVSHLLAALILASLVLAGCGGTGKSGSGSNQATEYNGLEVGTKAPDFRMKNQDQATVALSDYLGEKNVILVFYPADFTPV